MDTGFQCRQKNQICGNVPPSKTVVVMRAPDPEASLEPRIETDCKINWAPELIGWSLVMERKELWLADLRVKKTQRM